MDRKKMLSTVTAICCCPLVGAMAEPPRYNLMPVPTLDGDPDIANNADPTGCGIDGLFLGEDRIQVRSGDFEDRGMIWRVGEEPTDLAGSAWQSAFPEATNDEGWIAGRGVPWTGTDCNHYNNTQHIFLRSPEGEFFDLYDSGDCDRRIRVVDMSETGSVLFTQYTIPDSHGSRPYVVHSDGTLLALPVPADSDRLYELSGISGDGSVIAAVFTGDAGRVPVRWVDGELEVLSMPGIDLDWTFEPFLTVGADGGIIGTMNDGALVHPIQWDGDGNLEYLPLPASAGDAGAEYIYDDLIVGWMDVGEQRYVLLWHLENGLVADVTTHELAPGLFFGGWGAVGRAGDILVIRTLDETSYTTRTFLLPIEGDELTPLHDAIVVGDISSWGPDGEDVIWTAAYCHRDSDSFALEAHVHVGRHGGFIVERLRAGDTNGDRVVDGADLAYLLGAWGTDDRAADVDGDGIVNGRDLTIVLGDWG